MRLEPWEEWFDQQTDIDKRTMALKALNFLLECDDLRFGVPPTVINLLPGTCESQVCLYNTESGEDFRIPF